MNAYWWCSFCDPERPTGTQFLGIAIVEAPSESYGGNVVFASLAAHAAKCNPGGELLAYEWIAPRVRRESGVEVPAAYVNRLLTREEAGKLDRLMRSLAFDDAVPVEPGKYRFADDTEPS